MSLEIERQFVVNTDHPDWKKIISGALFVMIGHGEVHKMRYLYRHIDGKMWELDVYQ